MLEVRPTTNPGDARAVMAHPEIWDCISADIVPPPDQFDWTGLVAKWRCICGYVDGKPVALMMYHSHMDGQKLHIQVIPEYRAEYAKQFADLALMFAQYPLYAEIPDMYPNVQRFAESFGFESMESYQSPATKNGEHYTIRRYKRATP